MWSIENMQIPGGSNRSNCLGIYDYPRLCQQLWDNEAWMASLNFEFVKFCHTIKPYFLMSTHLTSVVQGTIRPWWMILAWCSTLNAPCLSTHLKTPKTMLSTPFVPSLKSRENYRSWKNQRFWWLIHILGILYNKRKDPCRLSHPIIHQRHSNNHRRSSFGACESVEI